MFATVSSKYMMFGNRHTIRTAFQLFLSITALLFTIGMVDLIAGNGMNHIGVARDSLLGELSAPGTTPAVVDEPKPAVEPLSPRMRAVLDHVTQRYRVSADALGPIFEAVQNTGRARRLDPLLIVAIIGIESRFNPYAESAQGAQGLMQVIPRFHADKLPEGAGKLPLFDPVTNVQIGAHVLQEAINRRGGLIAGLQQFGGAANDEAQAYANKVLAEKQRLEDAARRSGGTNA